MKKSLIAFIVLVILTPLGLLAPGSAWGEWDLGEIKEKVGFIPQGMARFNELMRHLLPDYGIAGFDKNFLQSALGYSVSAVVGIAVIALIFWLIATLAPEKREKAL